MIRRVAIDHDKVQQVVLANQCLTVLDLLRGNRVMDLTAQPLVIIQTLPHFGEPSHPPGLRSVLEQHAMHRTGVAQGTDKGVGMLTEVRSDLVRDGANEAGVRISNGHGLASNAIAWLLRLPPGAASG